MTDHVDKSVEIALSTPDGVTEGERYRNRVGPASPVGPVERHRRRFTKQCSDPPVVTPLWERPLIAAAC